MMITMKKLLSTALSLLTASAMIPAIPAAAETSALKDSGIDYTETVGTIGQPGCGYTTTSWVSCKPGDTPVLDPKGDIVLFFVDIGAFSSGMNGTADDAGNYTPGTDYDLDDAFFDAWRQTLANARKNGCMVAMRFRYDANGHDDPEPASFEQVLAHVSQIKQSHILDENADILAFVESGFVGKWGEQHGGKYTDLYHKAQLLDAMLDCVPDSVPVTVRTPDTFAKWAGIERSELVNIPQLSTGEDDAALRCLIKRVGLYNDGYMGSDSDLGTYANRQAETDWLGYVATDTYFGGEFSGDIEWAKKFDTYLPENAIPEMYKTHLSYINGNIFQLYNEYTFGEKYDVPGADNSAYYGQSVFRFIRDHLGYRFVLRDSDLTASAEQGGQVEVDFTAENTGFANPIPKVSAQAILEKDGTCISTPVSIDCNKWYSCTSSSEKLLLQLPGSIRAGEWNVYLKLSMGKNGLGDMDKRSLRFANEGVYSQALGANYLGTFTVTEARTHSTDNSFRQVGSDTGSTDYFTTYSQVIVDGADTFPGEWSDSDKLASADGKDISLRADDEYIYIRSSMPTGALAPVYNLQLKNPQREDEYFWIYYASNGFVYFNHDDRSGCSCKWGGGIVEFRIPYNDTWGFRPGDTISGLRVFLQDSGNDWKLMGDISAQSAVIPEGLRTFTAEGDLRLASGQSHTLRVFTPVEGAQYQWYKDGEAVKGAVYPEYTIEKAFAGNVGHYSVRVTAPNGSGAEVFVANVLEVTGTDSVVCGDADLDGKVSVTDIVMILQYSVNSVRYCLEGQALRNADANADGDVTADDAYLVQLYDAGLIDVLPRKK